MSNNNIIGGLKAFVISSDPQYPRAWVNGQEEYDKDPEAKAKALEALKQNYNNMQDYRNTHGNALIPVLINGDITEFGDKKDEFIGGETYLTTMKEQVFPILGDKENVLIGLGNHGYDNNVNDSADNGAAGGMLEWFPKAKPSTWVAEDQEEDQDESDDNDTNFDWRHNFYDGWTGDVWYPFSSYAYAVEKKDPALSGITYRFIQLNNYPEYARHFETGMVIGDEHIYNVTPSTKWLAAQLKRAGEKGQIAIVSMHQHNGVLSNAIKDLLKSANVTLVCVGHTHSISSKIDGTADLPFVNSGSSFKGTYLIAEADGDSLNIYAVKDNDHSKKQSIGSVPLKIANSNVPQEDIGRYVIFEKDYEEYTEGVGAYVSLAKTKVYYMQGDGYFNDLVESCTINRADEGTEICVYDHPGDEDVEGGDFGAHGDDYAVITIKKTLVEPIKISTFEEDSENEYYSLKAHYVNNLDHKISRVSVKLPGKTLDSTEFQEVQHSRNLLKQQIIEGVLATGNTDLAKLKLAIFEGSARLKVSPATLRRWVEHAYKARSGR